MKLMRTLLSSRCSLLPLLGSVGGKRAGGQAGKRTGRHTYHYYHYQPAFRPADFPACPPAHPSAEVLDNPRWFVGVGVVVAALALMGAPRGAMAASQFFTLGRASLSLNDDSSAVNVRYQSMRLNRALNVWNVEVTVENKSTRTLRGPFVLVVDSFTGTSGPQFT